MNAAFWRQTWALSYHPLSSGGPPPPLFFLSPYFSRSLHVCARVSASLHVFCAESGISVDDYLALAGQDLQLADAPPALTLHTRLGSGGFSEVYQGTLRSSVQVAVKVLKGERINEEGVKSFMHEVCICVVSFIFRLCLRGKGICSHAGGAILCGAPSKYYSLRGREHG